jgi:hypothetical protein
MTRFGDECSVPGCVGWTMQSYTHGFCSRHHRDRDAPPMKVTCECAAPDVEPLIRYGAHAAQCRRCGSPIEGTI